MDAFGEGLLDPLVDRARTLAQHFPLEPTSGRSPAFES